MDTHTITLTQAQVLAILDVLDRVGGHRTDTRRREIVGAQEVLGAVAGIEAAFVAQDVVGDIDFV